MYLVLVDVKERSKDQKFITIQWQSKQMWGKRKRIVNSSMQIETLRTWGDKK